MEYKKIFVTGGAGVIGTALVNNLLQQGCEVFVGDLKPCPTEWRGAVRYRQGDLNFITPDEIASFAPELFFHLAATFERSEESFPFFNENFHHNVKLSHHLMNCLKQSPELKRVIFASSYLIYDPNLYQSIHYQENRSSLAETDPIYPRNICGAAKLMHERELRFMAEFLSPQTSFLSARIFRVYGRGSRDIISRWIRMALKNEPLTLFRPEGRFDYIFADDVAEGLWRLAQTDYNGVVNLGSGYARSVQEVVDCIKQNIPQVQIQVQPSDILYENSAANISLLEKLTRWRPPHTIENGIEALVAYERKQLAMPTPKEKSAVLITSINQKFPLIKAVKEATRKVGQYQTIHGCDGNTQCIGKYAVDQFWQSPLIEDLTPENLIHYCHSHRIGAIIPTRDGDLLFYAKCREQLKAEHIHVMISSYESVKTCLDKLEFAAFLQEKGFPAIPTDTSPIGDSCAVKERWGAGSQQIGLNLSPDHALLHAKKLQEPIFQPYIDGQEWSVDLYCSSDRSIRRAVARTRDNVQRGESQVTTTVHFPKLEALCWEMALSLNLYGHVIFQVLADAKGHFHVIECNPRFGGASTASVSVGLDSFYWFFLETLGENLAHVPFYRHENDVRQIRHPADQVIPWSSSST